MGDQANSTSFAFSSALMKTGIMLAGVMGTGGPISVARSMVFDVLWKLTLSQGARRATSPLRSTSPLPFLTRISC